MKYILSFVVLLASFPCFAQTAPPPAGGGSGLEQKLQQMTPEQRAEFLKNHPELRERLRHHLKKILEKLQAMTPEQRQQFLQNHPKLQQFLNNHPKIAQKVAAGKSAN